MGDSEEQSVLDRYLNINLAVVEVCNGESQEEAWRRYLAEHPERVGVSVKIFNYQNSSPRKA
ncbi:MAG: hypothetical protein ACOZFS_01455 [Thermodesulfobacteriota bacterium]